MVEVIQESDVREFIKRLPELTQKPPTTHLHMLAARSKRAKDNLNIKIKDLVLERKIIRPVSNWRDRSFNAIYNLALLQHYGTYEFIKSDESIVKIPQEVMALYSMLSPRNVYQSSKSLIFDLVDRLDNKSGGDNLMLAKTDIAFFGALHSHRAKNVSTFVTIDQDNQDPNIFKEIKNVLSTVKLFLVTETSGGYHFVVDVSNPSDAREMYMDNKEHESILHKIRIKYAPSVEILSDNQEPIPGTQYARKNNSHFFVRILV